MKTKLRFKARSLMAIPPMAALCLAAGAAAQEVNLRQEPIAIARKAREEVKPVSTIEPAGLAVQNNEMPLAEDEPEKRPLVEPVSTLTPAEARLQETEIDADPEIQITSEEKPEEESVSTLEPGEVILSDSQIEGELAPADLAASERQEVEAVNELEAQGIIQGDNEINAPLLSADDLEGNESEQTAEEEAEEEVSYKLELENQGLETQVCEQQQKISDLESEIAKLQKSATDYMPLMNTMNQLMMMNMMMAQNQIRYQPTMLDMMGNMMSPMMMMQSMAMGASIANMGNLYSRQMMPSSFSQPQYNYNIGGDFYGRDYSVSGAQSGPAPLSSPYSFDFGGRSANFGAITTDRSQRNPSSGSQGAQTQIQSKSSAADDLVEDN